MLRMFDFMTIVYCMQVYLYIKPCFHHRKTGKTKKVVQCKDLGAWTHSWIFAEYHRTFILRKGSGSTTITENVIPVNSNF